MTTNRAGVRAASRLAVLPILAAALLAGGSAHAVPTGPDDLPRPSPQQLADAVRVWEPEGSVRVWDPASSVKKLEQVETREGETTITLAADILFTQDSSELPATAADRISELVADVPDGAQVRVHGHTDSVLGAVDNQELSTSRAQAVAAALREVRRDLELDVEGFAATRPAVREDPEDPATFAANRRVEIVYQG